MTGWVGLHKMDPSSITLVCLAFLAFIVVMVNVKVWPAHKLGEYWRNWITELGKGWLERSKRWKYTLYAFVYYVLQSQKVATGYANNKIHKEAVQIDI